MKLWRFPLALLLLGGLISSACSAPDDIDEPLDVIVEPFYFSVAAWELQAIPGMAAHAVGVPCLEDSAVEAARVRAYFAIEEKRRQTEAQLEAARAINDGIEMAALALRLVELETIQAADRDNVERILEKQIKSVLRTEAIANPWFCSGNINFPPVNLRLEAPPHLLVVSPRHNIETMRSILLKQELSGEDVETIEQEVEALDVSCLVLPLGGVATYPSFVVARDGLRNALNVAAEEWVHQSMFFRPQGFLYVLHIAGLQIDQDAATIAETTASMVGKEIGSLVYNHYYASETAEKATMAETKTIDFDFNSEMRRIRLQVDDYLRRGEVEAAEEYMREQRRFLEENGYYVRKLNQAYFAFYGTYADSPASVDPIGRDLARLRENSVTLHDFVLKAAVITSRSELQEAVREVVDTAS